MYVDCTIDGFTFNGGAPYTHNVVTGPNPGPVTIGSAVTYVPNAAGFALTFEGVKVSGNGAPSASGEHFPRNAYTYTVVTCTGSGATKACMTNMNVNAIWGTDLSWTGYSNSGTPNEPADDAYVLSGTYRSHHCDPDPALPNEGRAQCLASPPASRHIRFESMTNNSGRAIVYGSNGYSVVTRLAPVAVKERLSIVRTITVHTVIGTDVYPVGTAAAELYECAVGQNSGDWACVQIFQ